MQKIPSVQKARYALSPNIMSSGGVLCNSWPWTSSHFEKRRGYRNIWKPFVFHSLDSIFAVSSVSRAPILIFQECGKERRKTTRAIFVTHSSSSIVTWTLRGCKVYSWLQSCVSLNLAKCVCLRPFKKKFHLKSDDNIKKSSLGSSKKDTSKAGLSQKSTQK